MECKMSLVCALESVPDPFVNYQAKCPESPHLCSFLAHT